jgi:hypothetical protein
MVTRNDRIKHRLRKLHIEEKRWQTKHYIKEKYSEVGTLAQCRFRGQKDALEKLSERKSKQVREWRILYMKLHNL